MKCWFWHKWKPDYREGIDGFGLPLGRVCSKCGLYHSNMSTVNRLVKAGVMVKVDKIAEINYETTKSWS